jgi:hypothetical protein
MSHPVQAYFRHEHDEAPVVIGNADDADRLVDALLVEPFDNSMCTMYSTGRPELPDGLPDHEFAVAVNAEDGVGGLWYSGDDGSWFSRGTPSRHEQVYYCYMGSERDFPIDSEVPIETLRQAVREFLTSGGARPTCLTWQPYRPH